MLHVHDGFTVRIGVYIYIHICIRHDFTGALCIGKASRWRQAMALSLSASAATSTSMASVMDNLLGYS